MPIITLTSDFGLRDPYVASIKASIYSELNEALVVDISHSISPFDIESGAFVIKNSYKDFPPGSIHIIGVDELLNPSKKPIAALIDGHYFISSDNGLLSLICADISPKELVEINIPQVQQNSAFPTRDVFVPVACHLARGGKLSVVGQNLKVFRELATLQPMVKDDGKTIVGTIIYIDNFGNSITNISKHIFQKIGKKREFKIWFRNLEFTEIYENYSHFVKDFSRESDYIGKGLAVMGASGFLEIAIYKSNPQTVGAASTLFGLKKGAEIYVEFS